MRDGQQLWDLVDMSGGPDACWPWTGARDRSGYGRTWDPRTRTIRTVTRMALEQGLGRALEAGEMALHDCDNPPCCNPRHLHAGDQVMNAGEAADRGLMARGARHGSVLHPERLRRGPSHHSAKLDAAGVRRVRALVAGGTSHRVAADAFGLSQSTVTRLVQRKTWVHVA